MSRIWTNENAGEMVFRHDFNSQDPLTGMEWHVGHWAWSCQFDKVVCHLWSKDGAATASNGRRCFHSKFTVMIEVDHGIVRMGELNFLGLPHKSYALVTASIYDVWIFKYHLRCLKDRCVRVPPLKAIANTQQRWPIHVHSICSDRVTGRLVGWLSSI